MKKQIAAFLVGFLFSSGLSFAQQAPANQTPLDPAAEASQRLRLASTSADYPVTPGDQYVLSYRQGDTPASLQVAVDSDWSMNLGVFGRVDASNLTYLQLKETVERQILAGYPRSTPSLSLSSLGVFRIFVKGEIPQASYVVAWGLTRLNEVLDQVIAPSSCRRNVQIVSKNGTSRTCDLVKAARQGLLEENPYVRPGDVIVLSRVERKVQLAGEVREPGTYELLSDEQLGDLLEIYGGGIRSTGDASRVRIDSVNNGRATTSRIDTKSDGAHLIVLKDGDVVTVPPTDARLSVVSFEGAIKLPSAAKEAGAQSSSSQAAAEPGADYSRIYYSFREGERLSDALVAVKDSLSPVADLAAAYVVHEGGGSPAYVNLQALLASPGSNADSALRPNDRVVVPQSRFIVYVTGSVGNPGAFTYTPDRDVTYYITLAGGTKQLDPKGIVITGKNGERRQPTATIQNEDRIYVVEESVIVQGAVFAPGLFPFRVDQPPSYYIGLAGGADPERNSWGAFTVYDQQGKIKKNTDPLAPGDRVYLPTNNGMYNLVKYTPLIATVVSTILTIMLIQNNLK